MIKCKTISHVEVSISGTKEEMDKLLNEIKGLENPTSENICIWIWNKLIKDLPDLSKIEIMENSVTGFIYKGK